MWPTAVLAVCFVACGGGSGLVATPTFAGHGGATAVAQQATENDDHHDDGDSLLLRDAAAHRVSWSPRGETQASEPVAIRILGFNDFHGQIAAGRSVGGRPVGSAAVFASYLKAASAGFGGRTLIAGAGDMIGASPLTSALLRDEPTLAFLSMLGNEHCKRSQRYSQRCNIVGTPGNHEFDKGRQELLRQLYGGNHPDGPFLDEPWRGLDHGWVSANVVDGATGQPLLRPWTIKTLRVKTKRGATRRVQVGFIGAVLKGTPSIVSAEGIVGLKFLDEADAINKQVEPLRRSGVETIVVLIHQGGLQPSYAGDTDAARPTVAGEIVEIVSRLHPAVDVVVSGHSHAFGNALLPNSAGQPVLVTQAFSAGTAYSEIDLKIDPKTHDVIGKTARIITTFADAGPGLTPDAAAAELTARAEAAVAPLANRVIASYRGDITRTPNAAGESALGNLIADAQARTMGTRFAFMNPGGIRADLLCAAGATCDATYGALFAVQPFGNVLTKMDLTGAQVKTLLEQQFQPASATAGRVRFLQISGLRYTWDNAKVDPVSFACRHCIVEVRDAAMQAPLDPAATYTVTVNGFLADGGDDFTVLRDGVNRQGGRLDLDALIAYLPTLPQPFTAPSVGARIMRLN